MDFTPQMSAILKAIWTLRNTPDPEKGEKAGRRPLNHTKVEELAKAIMVERKIDPPKHLRQSWYNKKTKKEEWQAIRRAIEGESPLSHHAEVEDEIAKFDQVDESKEMLRDNQRLRDELAEKEEIIEGHEAKFEEFRTKAYNEQYFAGRFETEFNQYKGDLENTQRANQQLQRDLKKYQSENEDLRKKNKNLQKTASRMGADSGGSEATPLHKVFSPKIAALDGSDDENLLADYNKLKEEEWEKMMAAAKKKSPDHIYLVFHKFNIDIDELLKSKMPLAPGALSYIFACYEPILRRREQKYSEAAKLVDVPPLLFVIEGTPAPESNVLQFPGEETAPEKRGAEQRLQDLTTKRKFQPYEFIDEGYQRIWIERVGQ